MKTTVVIVVLTVAVVGGALGAANFGVIDVPGLSPIDFGKPVAASKNPRRGFLDTITAPLQALERQAEADNAVVKKVSPVKQLPPEAAKLKVGVGEEKLAELWNGLDPKKLVLITKKWPDDGLARVLLKMDPDQVSAFLQAVDPERARLLSLSLEHLASLPKPPDEAVPS